MATEIGDEAWKKFLDQHNSIVLLLDSHASLLVEMRKLCEDNSPERGLILGRLNTTEKLIATFKQSSESLQDITNRDEPVFEGESKIPEPEVLVVPERKTKKPKSQKSAKVVPDPSGFFTIDPNPTPIEELYKHKPTKAKPTIAVKTKEQPKRKNEPPRPEPAAQEGPKPKRTKKNHERNAPPPPTAEDEKEDQPDQQAPDDDDDSFVKAVEARSKAKEEKKKAKADKKRKRESEDSTDGVNGVKNKKKKDKHENKAGAAPSAFPVKVPVATAGKQKQQQSEKRPLAKADVEEHDEDNGPAKKRKRAPKNKSSTV